MRSSQVIALVVATLAAPPAQTARTVSGQLVDATGRAVRGATVVVTMSGDRPRLADITDESGRFAIPGVSTEKATVTVDAGPLVPKTQVPGESPDVAAVLEPGANGASLVITLVRGATIGGTVWLATGVPVEGARVTVTRDGAPDIAHQFVRTVRTNTSGAYRLAGLPEGAYTVAAAAKPDSSSDPPTINSAEAIDRAFEALARGRPLTGVPGEALAPAIEPTFYPGALSAAGAQHLSLRADFELQGVDITLLEGQPASLTGVVHDAHGEMVKNARLRLFAPGSGMAASARMTSLPLDADNRFAATGLAPGTYRLIADARTKAGSPPVTADHTIALSPGERTAVELVVSPPSHLAMPVLSDTIAQAKFGDYRVRLERFVQGARIAGLDDLESRIVDAAVDFPSVLPGVYRVSIRGAEGIVVDRVSIGAEAHSNWLTVTSEANQSAVLSVTRAGTVAGHVSSCTADTEAVLFPKAASEWGKPGGATRRARAGADCTFSIPEVIPGAYWLCALDTAPEAIERPEFLQFLVDSATGLDLAPGAHLDVTIGRKR